MSAIPKLPLPRIQFYKNHLVPWTAHTSAIGLTAPALTSLSTSIDAALDAYDVHTSAQSAAKTAAEAWLRSAGAVSDNGASLIGLIRAKAKFTGDFNVYTLADIPGPSGRTPVTTLGQPFKFKAQLEQDGTLTIIWKCSSPRATGVTYAVYRQVDNEPGFTALGGTGAKKFVDTTLPSGAARAMYKVQATRSTAVGPVATFTVLVGQGAVGPLTVIQPRLAA